jgi:CheY-like chemotaxis protein/HPt (histidine-containing phosphotransfer) domain-containing protein
VTASDVTKAAIKAVEFRRTNASSVVADSPALRVLVVDDVAMNRDIASAFISSAGYDVVCAADGEEAVALAAANDFLAILMDVRMPGIDGLEATRRVRAFAGARGDVPIVALTAQVFTEQINACRHAGMDTHVAKPFTLETLLTAIERGIASASARISRKQPAVPQPPPPLGAHLSVLNTATFMRTKSLLQPDAVRTYLESLRRRMAALQEDIGAPDATPEIVAARRFDVHALAGSAGMFGFDRLAFVCGHYDRECNADLLQGQSPGAEMKHVLSLSLTALHGETAAALGEPMA